MKGKRTFICSVMFFISTVLIFGPGISSAQELQGILTKYRHIFQREDIRPVLPKALEGLKADYIQERITVDRINQVLDNPDILKDRSSALYLPDLEDKYITILKEALPKENGELRKMFRDPTVLRVLQDRAAITQFEKLSQQLFRNVHVQGCGIGWTSQFQHLPRSEVLKVMIYALEFEYDSGPNAGYRCKTIEIRTGDASIKNLAGWHLYLGTLYNQGHFPLKIPEEHAQIRDGVLRLTPDMLGLKTFPCNTVNGVSHPLPGFHYVLKTDENLSVDSAYSCFAWGQNAHTTVNGGNIKSPRRVSSAALREMETPRLERYIVNNRSPYVTYMPLQEFTWDRVIPSDWLLPDLQVDTRPGSPPIFPSDVVVGTQPIGETQPFSQIAFSEVMFTTEGGLFPQPQWIELYNNTPKTEEPISLEGWKLIIESRDTDARPRRCVIELAEHHIASKGAALLVTRNRRHSKKIATDSIYDLNRHHNPVRGLNMRANAVLGQQGFALRLFSPDGTLVDKAGNLAEGRVKWKLPSCRGENGERTSLVRKYRDRKPLDGTQETSWLRAADMRIPVNTYYGHQTDIGTPCFRSGGINPVTLSHFRASRTEAGGLLEWTTESEVDNAGFNILRSETENGAFVKINASLIPGNGTTAERQTYTWTDTTAKPNTAYYYRLEDISLSGDSRRLLRVRMRGHISADGKSIQRWGDLKRER